MKTLLRMTLLVSVGLLLLSACPGPSSDKKPPGDPCVGNTDCADELCHKGTCALPQSKGEGETCTGDHECRSYRCEGKVCVAGNTADGESCLNDEECALGRCACTKKACAPSEKVCRYEGPTPDGGSPDAGPDGYQPDLPPREDAGPKPDGPVHDTLPADTLPADTQPPKQDLGCSSDPQCDDNNTCTEDTCNQTTKQCDNTPIPNIGCDDGDPCTHTDTCDATGACQGIDYASSCQSSICEDAVCDGQGGCTKTLKPGTCKIGTTNPVCALQGNFKPNDPCMGCDPAQNPLDWSYVDAKGCVKTVVKTQTGGTYFNDGPAASALLNSPVALALDEPNNKLYILDSGGYGSKIRAYDLGTNSVSTIVGPPGQGVPTGGADNGAGTAATFNDARDIAIDLTNKAIYVADSGNYQLRKVDLSLQPSSAGFVSTVFGKTTTPGWADGNPATATAYPLEVDVDSQGRVVIGNYYGLVRRWDPVAKQVTTLYTGLGGVGILGLDDDTVLAWDNNNSKLWSIDIPLASAIHVAGTGAAAGCADGPATTVAELWQVKGLGRLGSGSGARVFFGAYYQLRELSNGTVSTHAGACGQGGSADGGSSARFLGIVDTAVTSTGVVYMIDPNGLRRYTLP